MYCFRRHSLIRIFTRVLWGVLPPGLHRLSHAQESRLRSTHELVSWSPTWMPRRSRSPSCCWCSSSASKPVRDVAEVLVWWPRTEIIVRGLWTYCLMKCLRFNRFACRRLRERTRQRYEHSNKQRERERETGPNKHTDRRTNFTTNRQTSLQTENFQTDTSLHTENFQTDRELSDRQT